MIILESTSDYVDVTYSEIDYPFTQYPSNWLSILRIDMRYLKDPDYLKSGVAGEKP